MQREVFHEKGVDLTGSIMGFFEYFKTTLNKYGLKPDGYKPDLTWTSDP